MYADSSLIKRDLKENLVSTGWYRTKFFKRQKFGKSLFWNSLSKWIQDK